MCFFNSWICADLVVTQEISSRSLITAIIYLLFVAFSENAIISHRSESPTHPWFVMHNRFYKVLLAIFRSINAGEMLLHTLLFFSSVSHQGKCRSLFQGCLVCALCLLLIKTLPVEQIVFTSGVHGLAVAFNKLFLVAIRILGKMSYKTFQLCLIFCSSNRVLSSNVFIAYYNLVLLCFTSCTCYSLGISHVIWRRIPNLKKHYFY